MGWESERVTYEIVLEMDMRCSLRDYTKFIGYLIILNEKNAEDWVEYDCSGHIKLHNVSIGTMRKLLMLFVSLRMSEDTDVKIISVIDDENVWYPGRNGYKKLTEVLFRVERYSNGFTGYDKHVTENEVWSRFKQAMVKQ